MSIIYIQDSAHQENGSFRSYYSHSYYSAYNSMECKDPYGNNHSYDDLTYGNGSLYAHDPTYRGDPTSLLFLY